MTFVLAGHIWSTKGQTEIIFRDQNLTENEALRQTQTEIIFRDEQVSKVLIGTYLKEEMRDDSLQEAMDKLNGLEDVKVKHLPNVGGFVLTFKSEAHRLERSEDLLDLGIDWTEDHVVELPPIERGKTLQLNDLLSQLRSTSIPPNDSQFSSLWAFQNLANNADINMQEAWQEYVSFNGNLNDVVVAIVDTGVDYNNNELNDKMWKNPGEIPGNGIDDDNNGFVDDVYGADFTGDNAPGDPMDNHFHGTHVAGTVGAKGNNGAGIIGVAAYTGDKVKVLYVFLKLKTVVENPVTFSGEDDGSQSSQRRWIRPIFMDLARCGIHVSQWGNSFQP